MSFGKLPKEIEVKVLEMLPARDLAAMEATGTHYKDLIQDADIWKIKCLDIDEKWKSKFGFDIHRTFIRDALQLADHLKWIDIKQIKQLSKDKQVRTNRTMVR